MDNSWGYCWVFFALLSEMLIKSNIKTRISVAGMQYICYSEQDRSSASVPFHIT